VGVTGGDRGQSGQIPPKSPEIGVPAARTDAGKRHTCRQTHRRFNPRTSTVHGRATPSGQPPTDQGARVGAIIPHVDTLGEPGGRRARRATPREQPRVGSTRRLYGKPAVGWRRGWGRGRGRTYTHPGQFGCIRWGQGLSGPIRLAHGRAGERGSYVAQRTQYVLAVRFRGVGSLTGEQPESCEPNFP